MKIINVEKLEGCRVVVMTGRDKNVRKIAKELRACLYHVPRDEDYFMDYPDVVKELQGVLRPERDFIVITTQSTEFLDCLLTSDIDFILATVRKFDSDNDDTYRLRVLIKEEAWKGRRDFNMELRI